MYSIDRCMVCGEKERTIVGEYNRLIFIDSMWQNDLARFDHALCHGCGLVYATRRPDREEYDFLYEHFNEFLLRQSKEEHAPELTESEKKQVDRHFVPWWEIRSAPVEGHPYRKGLRRDLDNALLYLPHIMLHVPIEGAKVLHIRAKSSTLGDFLKRMLGAAQVDLITLFPLHAYIAEKNEGVRAIHCLDYEDFKIPFEDKYNLIMPIHVLPHMMDVNQTFHTFTSHLEDDGFLFLQRDDVDDRLFKKKKNLFAELRPFHFHQFDAATLERMLYTYGFDVVLFGYRNAGNPEMFGLAKLVTRERRRCPRIGAEELRARLDMYARWRDESILSLPRERCEALFGDELPGVLERVKANKGLKPDKKGRIPALRKFSDADVDDSELAIASAL